MNNTANNYTGATTVNDGTLGGSGTVPGTLTINSGATLSPGSGSSPGILNVSGAVTLNTGSTYSDVISGSTAGSGYSQLNVAGTLALVGSPTLVLSGTGGIPANNTVTLIHDACRSGTGTFGTISNLIPTLLKPSLPPNYTGGTNGGDVVLTEVEVAPTVTVNGTASYTAGALAAAISLSATVTEVGNSNLASATVSISSGFFTGDTLSFTPSSGITGTYSSGVLTLTGSASPAAYQTVLESVTFSSTSQNPTNYGTDLSRTISWTAFDGTLNSTAVTTTLSVAVIAAPVVTTTSSTLSYSELTGPQAIDPGVTVSDFESQNLASATVSISSGFNSEVDTLSETASLAGTGVTFSYTPGSSFATLSGTASQSVYQTLLQGVAYTNSSNDPLTFCALSLLL